MEDERKLAKINQPLKITKKKSTKTTTKSRCYCFTLNNYTNDDIENLKKIAARYIVCGKEVGKSGTPHLQGYIVFKSPRSFNAVKKLISGWHIEKSIADDIANIKYCTKDGDFFELGERPSQGKRKDLIQLKDDIVEGKITVDEICISNPNAYHEYGRTLSKIEDITLRKKYRDYQTTCDWYYGSTGCGKSRYAFENFDPTKTYVYPDDGEWWDGYSGQETVIIDEFRGGIKFAFLLRLIDRYPVTVRRRGREPAPFLAKHIIITSSMAPHELYFNLSENDKLDQLYRRINIINMNNDNFFSTCKNGTQVVRGNTKTSSALTTRDQFAASPLTSPENSDIEEDIDL
jgi:hypothetical protein